MSRPAAAVEVRYTVRTVSESWVLPEGSVPQSVPHDTIAERLRRILQAWGARTSRNVAVARDLAVRWMEDEPRVGTDPDVCVLEPPPPDFKDLSSLCLWKPGHVAPRLCFEVVSKNHPYKDYETLQDRYAMIGTQELVVFDPLLAGPRTLGGPVPLQMWRPSLVGTFERTHFGRGPVYSEILEAWLVPGERELVVADDRDGSQRWLTAEEQERAEKEQERAARIELERRLAELEGRVGRSR